MLRSLAEVPAEAAKKYGEKPAFVFEDRVATFAALERETNRCAAAFVSLGITSGDRITLYAGNCWEWVVCYYGALKAGAVINPVNVMLTVEEVAFIAKNCATSIILVSSDHPENVAALVKRCPEQRLVMFGSEIPPDGVLSFDSLLNGDGDSFSTDSLDSEAVCTIAYTSGTTGYPKGACLTHSNILLNVAMSSLMHARCSDDTVVSALPFSHVYGNIVLNSAIQCGMTLVAHRRFDASAALRSIEEHRATLFEGVPTMYHYMVNAAESANCDLSSVRLCTVGGQTMSIAKLQEVERLFGCPLIELWGMTELGGLGTTFAVTGPQKQGSIGVPLPYTKVRITDLSDKSKTVSTGETGELSIQGPIVMKGYYDNDSATREVIDEQGWLSTGDVAWMDEEGFVYVIDRKNDMIITAGYNIYPAELERVISSHPDVVMVAVGAINDVDKGELAKAYIVLKDGASPSSESILAHCRNYLAPYKVPRAIQFVNDLPKTSSGKVMRRRLHELDNSLQVAI
ncbi:long-chain fatty acid--CoA ligase [Parahaliea maris]|uniref:Long-chain fatty acid--CoA ligase n=1 Tax=Parahaliea maris TaxID=2716870 RepID=A0A5C8ZZ21_9GAMM|nr:AMP-binding protein [Parahaliea maris]TXS92770.1 long-chain fatty acid--CoA ligase [Parahaliea maris]